MIHQRKGPSGGAAYAMARPHLNWQALNDQSGFAGHITIAWTTLRTVCIPGLAVVGNPAILDLSPLRWARNIASVLLLDKVQKG
jgi:hypothetical protein